MASAWELLAGSCSVVLVEEGQNNTDPRTHSEIELSILHPPHGERKDVSGYKVFILPLLFGWYLRTSMPWADTDRAAAKTAPVGSRAVQDSRDNWTKRILLLSLLAGAVLRHTTGLQFSRLPCCPEAKNVSALQSEESAAPLVTELSPIHHRQKHSHHREKKNPYPLDWLLCSPSRSARFFQGRHCSCIFRPCLHHLATCAAAPVQHFPSLNATHLLPHSHAQDLSQCNAIRANAVTSS